MKQGSISSADVHIRSVTSDVEVDAACQILMEAANWLDVIGQPLWNPAKLVKEKVLPTVNEGTLYLASIGDKPVGTYVLLFEDPMIWPEAHPGEALYLHKLGIRRDCSGSGLSQHLLRHAIIQARQAQRPLIRLDCAPRARLCSVYESAGFEFHSGRTFGRYQVCRFQRTTQA